MGDDPRRPWSVDETYGEMQAVADALGDMATPILELARRSASAKWAYRRAQAKAYDAGVTEGRSNQKARDIAVWNYQVSPGVTVADLGEAADAASEELMAMHTATKAVIEQGKLIQSAHVSGREAAK